MCFIKDMFLFEDVIFEMKYLENFFIIYLSKNLLLEVEF